MKHNRNHNHTRSVGPPLVPVRFEFPHLTATTVCVAGTFNQWQPAAMTLQPIGGGHWLKDTVLAPGRYEYCLVVDGIWMSDPSATDSVPNPFSGRNSVLEVVRQAETAHLAEAENFPLKNVNQPKKQNL